MLPERPQVLRYPDGAHAGALSIASIPDGNTSDGYRFLPEAPPDVIGLRDLATLQQLRHLGFLPSKEEQDSPVIVNRRNQFAATVEGRDSTPLTLEDLVVRCQGLTLPGFGEIRFEPPSRTVDFYVVDQLVSLSEVAQRLRFNFANGRMTSIRTITVQGEGETGPTWTIGSEKVKQRQDCAFVVRNEVQPGENQREVIQLALEDFLASHRQNGRPPYAIVSKRKVRANFGPRTQWTHTKAVCNNGEGGSCDLTAQKNIQGTGPFLNFSVQEVTTYPFDAFPYPIQRERWVEATESGDGAFFGYPVNGRKELRIEIQSKGDAFVSLVPVLLEQIMGEDRLSGFSDVSLSVVHTRKIGMNGGYF